MEQLNAEEKFRLRRLVSFEEAALAQGFSLIAGVDEAGRGPLAGPVAAAACCIPCNLFFEGIDDSKKLTPKKREDLYRRLTEDPRVAYAVAFISAEEIDRVNIYQATIQAMLAAISQLTKQPDYLLVDGLSLPHPSIFCQKIIQGDAKSQSIAAASIIAKVARDRLMDEYDKQWPAYGFSRHKGYGTARHLRALEAHGPCPLHRFSFAPVQKYLH